MQSTDSEYGSPYLATCQVTFTFPFSCCLLRDTADLFKSDFVKRTKKRYLWPDLFSLLLSHFCLHVYNSYKIWQVKFFHVFGCLYLIKNTVKQ